MNSQTKMPSKCAIIQDYGIKNVETNQTEIKFGRLFEIYVVISNKLVGVLLCAGKNVFVAFDGETLFQRKDNNVIITLLVPALKVKEIAKEAKSDPDFQWGKCLK